MYSMSKRKKQRVRNAPEGSRAFRRSIKNRHAQKEVMQALRDVIAKKAANREEYFGELFKGWRLLLQNLDLVAKELMEHAQVQFPPDWVKTMTTIYDFETLFFFNRIMDNLTIDEQLELRNLADRINNNWQKFFAASLTFHFEALHDLVNSALEQEKNRA